MSDFVPTTWVEGSAPGISAAQLNRIEAGIDSAHNEIDSHTTHSTLITTDGQIKTGPGSDIYLRSLAGTIYMRPSGDNQNNALVVDAGGAGSRLTLYSPAGVGDVALYRGAADVLQSDDDLVAQRTTSGPRIIRATGSNAASGSLGRFIASADQAQIFLTATALVDGAGGYVQAIDVGSISYEASGAGGAVAPHIWRQNGVEKARINSNGHHLRNAPSVRVKPAANTQQNVGLGELNLAWDGTDDWDTDAMHDPAVNNSRMVCKTAGKYRIWSNVTWSHDATGVRYSAIKINGAVVSPRSKMPTSGGLGPGFSVPNYWVAQLAVNDYVEITHLHTATSALNLLAAYCRAGMDYISE